MKPMKKTQFIIACLALLILAGLGTASADEFMVTSTYDARTTADPQLPGSLRQAVADANKNTGPDTIVFAPSLKGKTINLNVYEFPNAGEPGPIVVTGDLEVLGLGLDQLTLTTEFKWITPDGKVNSGLSFDSGNTLMNAGGRLFHVKNGARLKLGFMTIYRSSGVFGDKGTTLVLESMRFRENYPSDPNPTSALIGGGTVEIRNSFIESNRVKSTPGKIVSATEKLVIEGSDFRLNQSIPHADGLAIFVDSVTADESEVQISNSFFFDSAMRYQFQNALAYITNCIFYEDIVDPVRQPGIVGNRINLTLTNTTIYHRPNSFVVGSGSHLNLTESILIMNNTVIHADRDLQGGPWDPLVYLDGPSTVIRSENNWVTDGSIGSLPDFRSGDPGLPSPSRQAWIPVSDSPLIDAGNNVKAVDLKGDPLTTDIYRNPRLAGNEQNPVVDIGAVEIQTTYAHPDLYSVDEDETLTVPDEGILENDTKTGQAPFLVVSEHTEPQHGKLTLSRLGGFTYVPDPDFYGVDSFTYKARANVGSQDPLEQQSQSTVVTIVINPVPDNPVGSAISYRLEENQTLAVVAPGVLSNDRDPDNLPPTSPFAGLSAQVLSGPDHGTLTLNPDGSFTYTPKTDFIGIDEFTYMAVDEKQWQSMPVTVTIEVFPHSTIGDEGLSHGFWKTHPEVWHETGAFPVGFQPDTAAGAVFDALAGIPAGRQGTVLFPAIGGSTLLELLTYTETGNKLENGARILMVQAVAALLNAAHVDVFYPLTTEEVKGMVNHALESEDRRAMIDLAKELDEYNNLGVDN